jgi:ABC-type glycerol-3-phosphate transport system substrate-binding protein
VRTSTSPAAMRRHLTRRHCLGFAGSAGLLTGLLAACSAPQAPAASQGPAADAPVTIHFATRSGKTEDDIKGILGEWQEAHPT